MNSTSGRFSASSAACVPAPAPSFSNAWMYWLIRSAVSPPVRVVSPRNITGLSRCRFSAATIRWPLWVPVRMLVAHASTSAIRRTSSGVRSVSSSMVTPASSQRFTPARTSSGVPMIVTSSISSSGMSAAASSFLPAR